MRSAWPSTSPSTSIIWTEEGIREETMAEAALKSRSGRNAGSDRRLQPHHRCDEAERPQHDLRRARHPDHRLRPHGAGRRHPRAVVPPRAECGLRRGDRRLPDQEARRLPHRLGARLPERPDRARPRHHQLLPDDPDLGLVRARDRRPAAGRLRGDGPARHRQAAVQGGLSRAARRRTSASASRAPSAPPSRAVRAASISTCRPSCSAR